MAETWIQWEPITNLSEKYQLDLIVDTYQEFRLILSSIEIREKKIQVIFEESVSAYRSATKNAWLESSIHVFPEKDEINWTFFKVLNSRYLSWISENTCGIYPQEGYVHFSFITTNAVIDVLNFDEPKIEIIENEKEDKKV